MKTSHHLLDARWTASVVHWNLRQNVLGVSGAIAIAQSPRMPHWSTLDVSVNSLGNDGIIKLLQEKHILRLQSLRIGFNNIDYVGAETLADTCTLYELLWLDIAGNEFRSEGIEVFIGSLNFPKLLYLTADGNNIDDVGAHVLANTPWRENMRFLSVKGNPIRGGAETLMSSRVLVNLQHLDLRSTAAKCCHVNSLALPKLVFLDLRDNDICRYDLERTISMLGGCATHIAI